jgi:hypothetical protein
MDVVKAVAVLSVATCIIVSEKVDPSVAEPRYIIICASGAIAMTA